MKLPIENPSMFLDNSFIPRTRQICIVTDDFEKTLKHYADDLGIGPWWIKDYKTPELTNAEYHGEPVDHSFRLALAYTGELNWEIIQPLHGPSTYQDFLDRTGGPGVQHIGLYYSDFDASHEAVVQMFLDRGYIISQQGRWNDAVEWRYFNTPDFSNTELELIYRPEGFVRPEPDRWYPHPPK